MSLPFAINGLGRIGRALLRIALDRPELAPVAFNDVGPADQLMNLLERDTLHGRLGKAVEKVDGGWEIDGRRLQALQHSNPEEIPWETTGARIVVDATGHCKSRAQAEHHLRGDVERVVVSANAPDVDRTLIMGVNDQQYEPSHDRVLSAASCTTNCWVPILATVHGAVGVERAMLNTVHSYNNDQRLLESPHPDPRRARAAALNMIPTTTSAVAAAEQVLPELAGRLQGFAVRVPVANVSLVDVVLEVEQPIDENALHTLFRTAADGELKGILGVSEEPLVSSDFLGDSRSGVVDLPLTQVLQEHLVRVVAWYDNEWGHASRLADLLSLLYLMDRPAMEGTRG